MENVLFISVHPDDETLGCGGTILKYNTPRKNLYWLIITDINEKHGFEKIRVQARAKEIQTVNKIYSFKGLYNLKFPTMKLDTIPVSELVKSISKVINEVKPAEIFMINRSDIHSDHKISFQAIISCTKSFRFSFIRRILSYECLSETEFAPPFCENAFLPNVFIDISDVIKKKVEVMKVYRSEVMEDNFPRSISAIKSLAAFRGSRIGVEYAEAFQLIFEKL